MNRLAISVPEAGELLGISRNLAYEAAKAGEIPTVRIGRRLVVPISRLMDMLEKHDAGPARPTPIQTPTTGSLQNESYPSRH